MESFFFRLSLSSIVSTLAFCIAIGGLLVAVYLRRIYIDYPRIEGIPEIPGADPLAGHIYKLGENYALTCAKWSEEFSWPVFQLRMGYRRAIMLNSFDSAREWIVRNQGATIDRPWFHTFHGVVSATSAATIGSSPWNDRTKKQRRVVGSFTTTPAIHRMEPMLDLETRDMITGLYSASHKSTDGVVPHIYQKRLALNVVMMLSYNTRFDDINDPLFRQIISDATTIASFRSPASQHQDFIPHLRYIGKNDRIKLAYAVRARRDKWLATMLDRVRNTLQQNSLQKASEPASKSGSSLKCLAEGLLEDKVEGLTKMDVKTILGGLMSGGFETVFSTAIIGIGLLASPEGQAIQERAYEDIVAMYQTPEDAFGGCVKEEKSRYITAFVKEVLRLYPPIKLLPARQTYKEFILGGATIPKGILVYINAFAIGQDKSRYGEDADVFRPERWLEETCEIPPPYHFAFGAGSRMCTAVNLSNRILYSTFSRLIISFKITASRNQPPNIDYVDYLSDATAANPIASDFAAIFEPRNVESLQRCVQIL